MDVTAVLGGRYSVLSAIAHGGMSDVVEARDVKTGEIVALKILRDALANDPEAVMRFEREARIASTLKSRHAVRIFDCGVTDGQRPFIVTELLQGQDLGEELRQRVALPLEEAAMTIAQVCHAMIEAHDAGIVHRDLKPANIFIADEDGTRVVKVLDFGLAAMAPNPEDERLTLTKTLFGSPLYMSPEAFRSAKSADARSDVWSLGVVFYECLTGVTPFVGDTSLGIGLSVTREDFPIASNIRPDLPHAVDVILARSLKKDPKDRYQSMRELMAAIEVFLPRGRNETLEFRRVLSMDEVSDELSTQPIAPPIAFRGPLSSDTDSSDVPTRIADDSSEAVTRIAPDAHEAITRALGPQPPEPKEEADEFEPVARTLIVEPRPVERKPLLSHTEVIPAAPNTEPTGIPPQYTPSAGLEFDLEKAAAVLDPPPVPSSRPPPPLESAPPPASVRPMLPSVPPAFGESTEDGSSPPPSAAPSVAPSAAPPPPRNKSIALRVVPVVVVLGALGFWVARQATTSAAPPKASTASASASATAAPAEAPSTNVAVATATATETVAVASTPAPEPAASAPPSASVEASASAIQAPTASAPASAKGKKPIVKKKPPPIVPGIPPGGGYQPPDI